MIAGYRSGGIIFCLKSVEWKEGIGSSPRINAKEKRPNVFSSFYGHNLVKILDTAQKTVLTFVNLPSLKVIRRLKRMRI